MVGNLLVVTKENSADFTAALEVVDVLDPAAPQVAGRLALGGGEARDVSVQGSFAYIAAGSWRGFEVVEVSIPARPRLLSSIPRFLGFAGRDVELAGQFVVGADEQRTGAALTDVSDPRSPQFRGLVDFFVLSGGYRGIGIARDERRVYLTASTSAEEHGTTGESRLLIGQYLRFPDDTAGVAPTVRLVAPTAGASVVEGSPLLVRVDAVDDMAVVWVELRVNGQLAASGSGSAPFLIFVPLGAPQLTLSAQAVDPAGNLGVAPEIVLAVAPDTQPPTLQITAPLNGNTVAEGRTFLMAVEASDNAVVSEVEFLMDGQVLFTDTVPPYEGELPAPIGQPTLTLGARARDVAGNVGSAPDVVVVVGPAGNE